jgi:hypothetical protein
MRGFVLTVIGCSLLAGCGTNSSPSKLTTVDQVPPECVSYFHKSAGSNKEMFDKLVAAWDPNDPQHLSPAQCKQLEDEMSGAQGSN